MSKPVRFEDEADAEYRAAGRWYEERRGGLGNITSSTSKRRH